MTVVSVRREGVGSPERCDGQAQVENLCSFRLDRSCICRAEQDCLEGRHERPVAGMDRCDAMAQNPSESQSLLE